MAFALFGLVVGAALVVAGAVLMRRAYAKWKATPVEQYAYLPLFGFVSAKTAWLLALLLDAFGISMGLTAMGTSLQKLLEGSL